MLPIFVNLGYNSFDHDDYGFISFRFMPHDEFHTSIDLSADTPHDVIQHVAERRDVPTTLTENQILTSIQLGLLANLDFENTFDNHSCT